MSELNDLIHTNAQHAFAIGVKTERERIIRLLEPLADHDEDMCYSEGKQECYPEDCSAPVIRWVIALIKGENK
jgi:hypothetical protein